MHACPPRSRRRSQGFALLVASLFAVVSMGAAAQPGPTAPQPPPQVASGPEQPRLAILDIAGQIELDAPLGEVETVLTRSTPALEVNRFETLGLEVMLLAVPAEDDCLPRGAPLICASIRVRLVNDPARGLRVSRVEAFQAMSGPWAVVDMFRHAGRGLGPSLQTESWAEQIRGMPRAVWRQRWRPEIRESTLFEVIVTAEQPAEADAMMPDPRSPAAGVGFVLLDPAIEDATMMARRRTICREGDAGCD